MEILHNSWISLFNNIEVGILGAGASMILLKTVKWIWETFKPLQVAVEYAKKWAYEKGRAFALFYKKRIKNKDFFDQTINDLIKAGDAIRDAFVKGLKSVE